MWTYIRWKKEKQAIVQDKGKNNLVKNIWKVVGSRDNENTIPIAEMVVGESSKSRRVIILESIQAPREVKEGESKGVLFISPVREVYESCLVAHREELSNVPNIVDVDA